ncbi:MAG: nuclear transport factor 2 family protein [Cytophagales bacterium]|nr:nuclear transport factor 2 family protein [Cytophagales bacterium]
MLQTPPAEFDNLSDLLSSSILPNMNTQTTDKSIGFPTPADQIRLAREYFAKVDAGDPSVLDMFTENVQVYFPKIGTASGKVRAVQLVQVLTRAVPRFAHDTASMIFTQSSNRLVVEGTESGVLADGTPFPDDARSEGRFCNVFEFCGKCISRLHIYTDPDFRGRYFDLYPQD